MLKLYIMCGLAFSGKSTLARKIAKYTGSKLIAFDKLWIEKEKEQPIPKNANGWRFIRKVGQDEVTKTLQERQSVVYDDTNVRFEHRKELRKIARRLGAKDLVVYLNTPMELIRKRDSTNKIIRKRHDVEPENFNKVVEQMEVPTSRENYIEFAPETNINDFIQKI